ncbi:MAG: hypothetical protein NTW95_08390 [Candidatus Aminicenantes bacterium]|nr:hypothetical protein [Candidatus Aminicenantes bacterium]
MTWKDLLQVKVSDNFGLTINAGPVFLVLLLVGIVTLLIYIQRRSTKCKGWSVVDAEVQFGGIGKVKIRPSHEDVQVAHKAWVELVTRKAGLPFDEDHDVIVEVYDSWYALFQEMRSLAKEIPAEKLRNSKDTQELIRLLIDALNLGLRPHLTKWQAKFRHWYEKAIKENGGKSPQEIQKEYSHYRELVDDLKIVNKQIVDYAVVIKQIAQGCKEKT